MNATEALRNALQRITDERNAVEHPVLIAELARQHPHSVVWKGGHDQHPPYNCFQFALGLERSERIYDLLVEDDRNGRRLDLKFGTEFVERLVLKSMIRETSAGHLTLYLRDARPRHAGRLVREGVVLSKWGIGHLWEHGLWEVPSSYGGEARRFTAAATVHRIEAEFLAYRRELMGRHAAPR
jgi:hypothetical protein